MTTFTKARTPELFKFARDNRKNATEAEKILWHHLRNRKLNGFKFRRQHPCNDFIADFFCQERRLVIELDGEFHARFQYQDYDKSRTEILTELGVTVMRFSNSEVTGDLQGVLKRIGDFLKNGEQD